MRQVLTGWRLEYRDPGESGATYAGTHGSLDLAMTEARASYGPAPRVPRQGTAPRDHRADRRLHQALRSRPGRSQVRSTRPSPPTSAAAACRRGRRPRSPGSRPSAWSPSGSSRGACSATARPGAAPRRRARARSRTWVRSSISACSPSPACSRSTWLVADPVGVVGRPAQRLGPVGRQPLHVLGVLAGVGERVADHLVGEAPAVEGCATASSASLPPAASNTLCSTSTR